MHVLTMEGLIGAGVNAKLVDTPMRAAREAERRGDTAAMEQALGYAGAVTEEAEACQKKAEKGMEKEAEEAKKEEKELQEALAEKRAEEKEEWEARTEEARAEGRRPESPTDILELSEEGKRFSEGSSVPAGNGPQTEGTVSPESCGSVYTETGEIVPAEPAAGVLSLSV